MEVIRYQMKYKIDEKREQKDILSILGKEFVRNNKNKGKLIIGNKKYYLNESIQLNNNEKSELKIDILLSKDICYLNCQ